MWIAIIIGIAFIFYLFFKDKNEMLEKIESKGGIQEKYKELVNFFINRHGLKLKKLSKEEMIFYTNEPKFRMQVQVVQSFDKVLVHWHSINTIGEVKMNWEFSDSMDQSEMIEKIMLDVFNKQRENMQNNIEKNINDLDW